jgi:hypothetical protein
MSERSGRVIHPGTIQRMRGQYFSDRMLAEFSPQEGHYKNIQALPDLSSIAPDGAIKKIGDGYGFDVYQVGTDTVLKTEKVYVKKNLDTGALSTSYPWMGLGMGQERHELDKVREAVKRRELHLAAKLRLESVGIKTAEYKGSVILPSFPVYVIEASSTSEIKPPSRNSQSEANSRIAKAILAVQPPIYGELWQRVRGLLLDDKAESAIYDLYHSQEGRNILRNVALGLLELTRDGYVCDVNAHVGPYMQGAAAKTARGYPYPRNFILTEAKTQRERELVAFDFNLGIELSQELWWKSDFSTRKLFVRDAQGNLTIPYTFIEGMNASIDALFPKLETHQNLMRNPDYFVKSLKHPDIHLRRLQAERDVFYLQAKKLFGQLHVSKEILSYIEGIENKKGVGY